MHIVETAARGLVLLAPYVNEHIHLSEAGGFLCVWSEKNDAAIPVEPFTEFALKELGWMKTDVDGWCYPMSS